MRGPSLPEIVREWGRIGCLGFGGPPAHIAMLHELCVVRRRWLSNEDFENAIAATSLLPGPASTQLAIYCAWRLRGTAGALVGGFCFIAPSVVVILALSVAFLASSPPAWLRGAGAGAGAAVAAVAVKAGASLVPPIWARSTPPQRIRVALYALAGAAAAAGVGPWLVFVLLGCGAVELVWRQGGFRGLPALLAVAPAGAGLGALAWMAFKVGALSFGGGFVIVPLMQGDAVGAYHWMTNGQFLDAVALGQVTPGPVTATVAAVGYAAHGIGGGVLAALVAFAPSFSFVLLGAERFHRLIANARVQAFLAGAAPAAVGAIAGSAIPLTRALGETWQLAVLGAAVLLLFVLRRGVVLTLVAAGAAGAIVALAGGPLPR
ncbi:MAG: chromate transporter [Thermoleophilaceae bacterium]|nr:chromate transporter [Thermoleophilaceae bacterium]